MFYHAECPPPGNCKWVIKALILASDWHEQDAGALGGKSPQGVWRLEPHTGGVSWSMEGMERV